jgi:hypothetical protein
VVVLPCAWFKQVNKRAVVEGYPDHGQRTGQWLKTVPVTRLAVQTKFASLGSTWRGSIRIVLLISLLLRLLSIGFCLIKNW